MPSIRTLPRASWLQPGKSLSATLGLACSYWFQKAVTGQLLTVIRMILITLPRENC